MCAHVPWALSQDVFIHDVFVGCVLYEGHCQRKERAEEATTNLLYLSQTPRLKEPCASILI